MEQLELRLHFVNGPFAEIVSSDKPLQVEFIAENQIIHSDRVRAGEWIRARRRWFCDWRIRVLSESSEELYQHELDFKNQNIRVYLDSKSLGDTLAWIPQVERFAEATQKLRFMFLTIGQI